MVMMRYGLVFCFVVIAGVASAQETQFLSADGGLFSYEENRHGAVLMSIDPSGGALVADDDAGPSQIGMGGVLYLGRSCDAFSRQFGEGHWISTDGGFLVEFPGLRVAFPGQEIDVVSRDHCRG